MCRIRWGAGALWGLVWFYFVFVCFSEEGIQSPDFQNSQCFAGK